MSSASTSSCRRMATRRCGRPSSGRSPPGRRRRIHRARPEHPGRGPRPGRGPAMTPLRPRYRCTPQAPPPGECPAGLARPRRPRRAGGLGLSRLPRGPRGGRGRAPPPDPHPPSRAARPLPLPQDDRRPRLHLAVDRAPGASRLRARARLRTEGRNLILTGKPSRGRTHLTIALAYRAIQNGFDPRFVTAAELIDTLSAAFRRGQLGGALTAYTHPAVLSSRVRATTRFSGSTAWY